MRPVRTRSAGASAAAEEAMAANPFIEDQLGRLHRGGIGALGAFAAACWRQSKRSAAERPELVGELRAIRRGGFLLAWLLGFALVAEGVPALPALAWPPLAWLVLCAWVWAELGLVRHPLTGEPAPHIGPANLMTVFRGWAAVPVLLIAQYRTGPTLAWVLVCLAAGFTDLFDGTVAIRLRQESRLGRLLDPVLDACFFSAAAYSLARWHLLPGWLAGAVAVRYFAPIVGGLALLFIRGRSLPVRHTPWGQRSTAATALALFLTWMSTFASVPEGVLAAVYVLAVACMLLALAGILRRAPVGA